MCLAASHTVTASERVRQRRRPSHLRAKTYFPGREPPTVSPIPRRTGRKKQSGSLPPGAAPRPAGKGNETPLSAPRPVVSPQQFSSVLPPTTDQPFKGHNYKMPDKRDRINSIVGMNEMAKAGDLGKALLAEAIGTLFITYFGILSCIAVPPSQNPPDLVLIALTFGFVVMVAVQALGHVSGANLNPAVTCGLVVTGRITIVRAVLYVVAQCLGAIAAAGMAKGVTPENAIATLGGTGVQPTLTVQQALGVEFMLGFLLVFVVFGVIDPNKPDSKIPASLAIGLAVAVGHLSSVDYTGSSMNPARSLGPAVIMNKWENHWVYWLGPCLGGVVAAILYTTVLSAPAREYSAVPAESTEMKRLGKNGDNNA